METHLLKDLAVVMTVAGLMTLLCHRLRQPVVIGYLMAGLMIGPHTPPFSLVGSLRSIHTMAELGLVFLLFSLGLEFNLPKIRKVGASAGLAVLLEVIGMLAIGYALGQAFGWNRMDSIFLGAILSISSTTIIVKVFMDFKMMNEKFVQVVFGILVLEDIVAVAILSILSGLGLQGGPDAGTIFFSFVRIGLFVTLFLVLGLLLIPRFIQWVAAFGSKEVLGIVTLGICLGGSLLASHFQLSIALGAFLAGAILAASREIHLIEEWIHPVRDMFSAIFFVSAGMLIQPDLLWQYKGPIFIVTVVTLIGKVVSGSVGSFLAGYDPKTSARVGMSLAQIGEFSFVIAALGVSLKVTSDFLYPLAVMVSSLTTLATPYLIKNSDRIVDAALGILPARVCRGLDNYQAMIARTTSTGMGHGTTVFSRYLVRLGIYVALLVAWIMLMQVIAENLGPAAQNPVVTRSLNIGMWTVTALLSLPLFMAISKYANHIILLLVTRSKFILRHLEVHAFYSTLHRLTMAFLLVIFLVAGRPYIGSFVVLTAMAIVISITAYTFRRTSERGREWLESLLDQITGLATSEPTRQAVIRSGENSLLLKDITDQVGLGVHSPYLNKTVRELGLREKTGVSIVAIYRDGNHIANPGPDTRLAADDVLVLLGEEKELVEARKLLG